MANLIKYTNTDKVIEVASTFRLLSDPTRFKLLCCLIENPEGMCVYELAGVMGVSHSAMSHQLNRLEDRDIVQSFRDGQSVCYQLKTSSATKRLKQIIRIFDHS